MKRKILSKKKIKNLNKIKKYKNLKIKSKKGGASLLTVGSKITQHEIDAQNKLKKMYIFREGKIVTTCLVDNLNFRRFEIPSDGDCLFASIALAYNLQFKTEYTWKDLKLMILDRFFINKYDKNYRESFNLYLQFNWNGFQNVIDTLGGEEQSLINYATHYYLETLKKSATECSKPVKIDNMPGLPEIKFPWSCYWGSDFEIGQIAKYLNVTISVYSIKTIESNCYKVGFFTTNEKAQYKIYLLYTGSHYECLHLSVTVSKQLNFDTTNLTIPIPKTRPIVVNQEVNEQVNQEVNAVKKLCPYYSEYHKIYCGIPTKGTLYCEIHTCPKCKGKKTSRQLECDSCSVGQLNKRFGNVVISQENNISTMLMKNQQSDIIPPPSMFM